MNYNQEQLAVINSLAGAYLLSAPVGTGKTTVLVERVIQALRAGFTSEEILCLTFTNKAAEEMKSRLRAVLEKSAFDNLTISTFHGFCSYFIRCESKELNLPQEIIVIDEDDQSRIMKSIIEADERLTALYPDQGSITTLLDRLYQDKQKRMLADYNIIINLPDGYQALKSYEIKLSLQYDQTLADQHLLDFNGLVLNTLIGLYGHPQLLAKWSQRYKFIQLDEFQDTHLSEYLVVKQLARVHKNITLIGDLDQTIYGWRGSDPEKIIKLFKNHFAPVTDLALSINYRSPQGLILAFKDILASMNRSYTNQLSSSQSIVSKNISIISAYNYADEALMVTDEIMRLKQEKPDESCAVLVRAKFQMSELVTTLTSKGVPFVTIDQYDFFKRQEIKDVLAYLKILYNKHDLDSAYRMVQRPLRKIGATTLDDIRTEGLTCGLRVSDYLDLTNYQRSEPFEDLLNAWSSGRIIVLDTETTGFSPEQDDIIQIYAREIVRGKLGREFHRYIKPGKSVGASFEVHRISDEFLNETGESAPLVLQELAEFIGSSIVVGHNVKFDRDMIIGNGLRHGISFNFSDCSDTLDLARRLINSENYKLGHLAKILNLAIATHSADDDVAATIGLLEYLIIKLREGSVKRQVLFKKYIKKFYLLANDISRWQSQMLVLRPAELLLLVWQESGLEEFYAQDLVQGRQENIHTLIKLFSDQDDLSKLPKLALKDLLNYSSLSKGVDFIGMDRGKVPVITIHQSKGLEFDNVFIIGLNEGRFPRYRDKDLEEQKRLFYVAATRAKQQLYLSYAQFDNYNKSQAKSSFLSYINPDLIRF